MPICHALDLLSIAIEAPKIKEEPQQGYVALPETEASYYDDLFFADLENEALESLRIEEDRYFLDLANA